MRELSIREIFSTLGRSVREYRRPTILTPVLVVGEVAGEVAIPFITASLIDQIKSGLGMDGIVRYSLVLVALALVSLAFGVAAGITCADASAGLARNLRHDMFYNIQTYSFANIDEFSNSSLVTRLTTDITNVQMAFMMIIRVAIRAPLNLVFSLAVAIVMSGSVAFVYLAVIPLLGIGLLLVIKTAMPIFKRVFRKYDALNESVQENILGIRVVKSYVREDYETRKFGHAADDVFEDFRHAERILAFNSPMMNFAVFVCFGFVMYFGSYVIISTRGAAFDVGQFSALTTYGFQILISLMMLSMVFVMITMADESSRRICEVLDERPTISNPEDPVMEVPDGSIDFDHVSFKYSPAAERTALTDIDLHIRSGETIGIVGGTGSSKSSLVQLVSRLYDASDGMVRVGGRDVREYDLDVLRGQVAVVLQKNVLFSGTISENMRWGNPDATDDQIREACRLACADEFVRLLPKGYDTYIEQGGTNVSGGQKQRLCIARALLKNPKVLILDDSTSAVDTKTDAIIREGLRSYLPAVTKIIIAQRTASVEDADRIIVMDDGAISAMGTSAELLETSDIYRETYLSQNKSRKDGE